MANDKKLDCVILGLLSHDELTGYEIKKRIDTSLKYFWGASYGSIYPTLNDLVNRGLAVRRSDTKSKRKKQIYTITDTGRNYLKEWLTIPAEKDELRYETLLKLFFGKEQGAKQALCHIEAFRTKIERELSELSGYEKILKSCPDDDGTHKYYLLTAGFGIKTCRAYLEWCEDAKKILTKTAEGGKETL